MNIIDWRNITFPNDRSELRRFIVNSFLEELAGNGRGQNASRYKYLIKDIRQNQIYLMRPAQFNKGFDFTLNVSNINFNPNGRRTTRPTHQNIYDDLYLKKEKNSNLYQLLKIEIDKIFRCENIDNYRFNFNEGLDSEILLECIKWLFIEQDITYWNYSGRNMLYNSIIEI